MNKLEIVREKLQSKYRVVKTDEDLEWNRAIEMCTNIINAHISREDDPKITRSSRDNGGWIPVEERLPEPYQQVLISMYNNLTYVTIGHYSDYERKWHAEKWISDWGVDVKAWRPLPASYRPEQTKESETH